MGKEKPVEPVQVPKNSEENSVGSNIQPNFFFPKPPKTTERKTYHKSKVGRQRSKEEVKELFEMWYLEGRKKTFSEFYRGDLSADMRSYYKKHYIEEGGKSHAEFIQWREEFRGAERAERKARALKAQAQGSKVIHIR